MYGTCMVHVWYMYGTCMVHALLRPTSYVLYQDAVIPYLFLTEEATSGTRTGNLASGGSNISKKTFLEKTTGLRFAILPPAGQRSQKKTSLENTKGYIS